MEYEINTCALMKLAMVTFQGFSHKTGKVSQVLWLLFYMYENNLSVYYTGPTPLALQL